MIILFETVFMNIKEKTSVDIYPKESPNMLNNPKVHFTYQVYVL